MRRWLVGSLLVLVGCATTHPPPPPLSLPMVADVPVVEPLSPPPLPVPLAPPLNDAPADPAHVITRANAAALVQPTAADFVRSTVVFRYQPGAIYLLTLGAQEPLDIILQPGERLLIFSSGDERFADQKAEDQDPVHILMRASRSHLTTKVTMVTTKGFYYLKLRSRATEGLTSVMWRHPEPPVAAPDASTVYGVAYGVEGGEHQAYRPLYAWDDGRHTFLLFPEAMPRTKAPIISVGQLAGPPLVVNYAVHDRLVRIDRILDVGETFELLINAQAERQVTVVKTEQYHFIRCPGSDECGVIRRWTRRPMHGG